MRQQTLSEVEPDGEQCPTCGRIFETGYGLKQHHAKGHGESLLGTFECVVCGEESEALPSVAERRMVCSTECRSEWLSKKNGRKISRACRHCGEMVERCSAHMPDNGPFCSRKCHREWRTGKMGGENNPNYSRVSLCCDHCGDEFDRVPSRVNDQGSNFCSRECRNSWMLERPKEEHPRWLGERVTLTCEYCGEVVEVPPGDRGRNRFCSEECWRSYSREVALGPKHHMWRGGVNFYRAVRRNIGPRRWASLGCGPSENCALCGDGPGSCGERMSRHHIVPLLCGGTNTSELLMPLCRSCHRKVESYTQAIPEIDPVLVG